MPSGSGLLASFEVIATRRQIAVRAGSLAPLIANSACGGFCVKKLRACPWASRPFSMFSRSEAVSEGADRSAVVSLTRPATPTASLM